MSEVAILNVGAGDTKLSFDPKNPAECIRAARIVKDMIRRGYALMVEVERDGTKAFERALDFDEKRYEYIIADFDPVTADREDKAETRREAEIRLKGQINGESSQAETQHEGVSEDSAEKRKRGRTRLNVPAGSTRSVAVSRSAGG